MYLISWSYSMHDLLNSTAVIALFSLHFVFTPICMITGWNYEIFSKRYSLCVEFIDNCCSGGDYHEIIKDVSAAGQLYPVGSLKTFPPR